jgi:hypothetical protein
MVKRQTRIFFIEGYIKAHYPTFFRNTLVGFMACSKCLKPSSNFVRGVGHVEKYPVMRYDKNGVGEDSGSKAGPGIAPRATCFSFTGYHQPNCGTLNCE